MSEFRGFPPEAIEFLRELEAHDDREWFKVNRLRHEQYLQRWLSDADLLDATIAPRTGFAAFKARKSGAGRLLKT